MSNMEEKHDIAYTIIHGKCDYTVDDETINFKCEAEINQEDNSCKECGSVVRNSYTAKDIEDLHSMTKDFIIIISILIIAGFISLSPIEFDINFLGFTVHPKLKYLILDQAVNVEIGAMSFKKENVSITDFISLKYKYLTNKKEFDDIFKNINSSIDY